METTARLLDHFARRLGALSAPVLLILAVVLTSLLIGVAALVADTLLAASGPIQMAPFRWSS